MKNTISKIAKYAAQLADPKEIILFGSAANQNFNAHSDVDLLIICDDTQHKDYYIEKITHFSHELSLKTDILVYSVEQVEQEMSKKGSFISAIVKDGKKIYKK